MKRVSFITPIYHGKKYLPGLMEMIAANAESAKDIASVEWIVVNDDPEEQIDALNNQVIQISIINHEKNLGVQSSRIEGIEKCGGEYVVMLDQDDLIMPDYIVSQLNAIGDNDGVICRVKQDGKDIYLSEYSFEGLFNRNEYILNGNTIISPGQVLLKKESIPVEWKEHLLKKSGADDHLLWLLMLAYDATFVPNDKVLFERIINLKNNSFDLEKLCLSELEAIRIVLDNDYLSENESNLLREYKNRFIKRELQQYSKENYIINVINRLLGSDNGKKFSNTINKEKGSKGIAIYGGGVVCKTIISALMSHGIKIDCVVDRNYESLKMSLPVVAPENLSDEIGFIIVTVYNGAEKIKQELQTKYIGKKIMLVSDLVE